jgi:phage repressor protein C with HTH and peptisase S24 domain
VGKTVKSQRYKNEKFLKALGERCRQLRLKNGYTIDRLYREGDQLSTSTIHRLESGNGDTQIGVIYRYAQALGVSLKELFNFEPPENSSNLVIPFTEYSEKPNGVVPYYSIKVAAGSFGQINNLSDLKPIGWVKAEGHRNLKDYFATQVSGNSMEPSIPNGSICLFRIYKGGTRQNRIFLIKARGLIDPSTEESFVVKKYKRITDIQDSEDRSQTIVHLISENKIYPPIILVANNETEIEVVAEFVEVLA